MLRNEWAFDFKASDLMNAAKEKEDFHKSRLDFWKTKKEEVITNLRAHGLEISETISELVGKSYAAAQGPQVIVNNDYQQKLNECTRKIQEHEASLKAYTGWVATLATNSTQSLKLHYDDYLYLYSK